MLTLFILALLVTLVMWADLPAATNLSTAGLLVSGALPTAGALTQTFANTGKELLLVRNGSGAPITVTLTTQEVVDDGEVDLDVEDPVITVPAGETHILGPFKCSVYNDTADKVTVALSAITTVTVQVVKANTFGSRE